MLTQPDRSPLVPWSSERVQTRITEVEAMVADTGLERVVQTLEAALTSHTRTFDEEGVVLYAGTNVMTERAQRAFHAGIGTRPSLGWPGEKFQTGIEELDVIEVTAMRTIAAAMAARYAEIRPPSATIANLAVYTALTQPGDTIAALPEVASGHTSHREGAPMVRGLRVADLPYDPVRMDVDIDALPAFLSEVRPKLVVIGAALMLFPHDVERIAEATEKADALLMYDGSHVAGLIAGNTFQSPLRDGADLLTFSTYKSFGGPPGGVICTNDASLARSVSEAVYPVLTANYDIARLVPLAIAAAEALRYGAEYARQCIDNARALANALAGLGFDVVGRDRGFTESHHVAVDVTPYGGGETAARSLAEAGIYLSAVKLPSQHPSEQPAGLRIGTQEVTRRGMSTGELSRLADLMSDVLRAGKDPAVVRQGVRDLSQTVGAP